MLRYPLSRYSKYLSVTNAQNTTDSLPKFIFERENIDKILKEPKYGRRHQIWV